MTSTSLEISDAQAAAVAVAPRVSLASMEAKIKAVQFATGAEATRGAEHPQPDLPELGVLSLCLLMMDNGFILVGKSAPASAANFDAELGRKLAYEDAIRQLWRLEGYALRERLHAGAST